MVTIRITTLNDADCEMEWELAYLDCEQWLSEPNPAKGVTGGCSSVHDCAKGLVSELCGGNSVSY